MKITKNLFPNNSFIYEYLDYSDNLETAIDFDFWSAIWCLSMICNRNFIINRPNSPLFMNFYITLIAESGIARKSTAINLAKELLSCNIEEKDNIQLINSGTSAAKFNYILTKSSYDYDNCIIGITCPEFITFYKNKSIIECFTDLYDCPNERKGYGTFTNGEIDIRNVFVSSLSASTPNYYFKAIGEEEIEGGFTSRNIIVYANKGKRKIPWAKEASRTDIFNQFRRIKLFIQKNKHAEIILTNSAIRRYSSWYTRRRLSNDLYSRSFEAREQDFVLKLAGILAINDFRLQIEEKDIELSIKIINYQKNLAQKFFNNELFVEEKSTLQKTIERIRDIIHSKSSNGIGHRDLYLRVHNSCTNDEYNYIINVMHELNMIEKLQGYNSKQIIYRETNNLFKINVEKIVKKFN